MTIAFNQNARFVTAGVSCEVVPTLKGFDSIVATFYGCVRPTATMVVHDLRFPVAHCVQGALNSGIIDGLSLSAPTNEALLGYLIAGRTIVPRCERFLPLPHAAQ